MNPEIRETVVMTFATSRGTQKNMRIRDPRPNVSSADVESAATSFITANPYEAEIGSLERLVGAEHVVDTITTVI